MMQKIAPISKGNDFNLIPVGNVLGGLQIGAINSNFWEHPLYEISEYAFNLLGQEKK